MVAKGDADGMPSLTLIKSVRCSPPGMPPTSLLEIALKTGRTHQIRVHLAHQGYPIVGDDKYGDFDLNKTLEKSGLGRMFLHAYRLEFVHPATQEAMAVVCPLDEGLMHMQAKLLG